MKLHYESLGTGSNVLVLLHGFPLGKGMWADVVPKLAADMRVIVPELRGHGESPAPAGTYDMTELADDVAEMLDDAGVNTPVILCGLSMGGYVALAFAANHGERLRALILCDTRAAADAPDAAENRRKLADRVEREGSVMAVIESFLPKLFAPDAYHANPGLVERVSSMMAGQPVAGVAACLRGMAQRRDYVATLPRWSVPALVIVGEHDQITPPNEARRMATALPNGSLRIISGSGHLTPLEAPDAIVEAIRDFVGSSGVA